MGRLHLSSAPKYIVHPEPVSEDQVFARWADQEFDPESDVLSGHAIVYEAFLDGPGHPPVPDDSDSSELSSETASSVAADDHEEDAAVRGPARQRPSPSSPALSTRSLEVTTNEFDDFVRVEAPPSDSLAVNTVANSLGAHRPSSPLRQSITLDDLPDQPASDTPEITLQSGDAERLFAYYHSHDVASAEHARPHHSSRAAPRMEYRPWPAAMARRVPGNSRLVSNIVRIGPEVQRTPLAHVSVPSAQQPRPRSASVSDVRPVGARVPQRWHAAVDGVVISSQVLAQR
ncbi:hypothetical protein RhiJN_16770 [Ceratobasidium sp. AG-Ba]|nr:hypothetical protein RhiJN_16770 [Ceratobasidium sp. AG-Ba]